MFQLKEIWKTKTAEPDLKLWTAKPQQLHHMGRKILKIPSVSRAWSSGHAWEWGIQSNILKRFFSLKISDLGQRPTSGGGHWGKSLLDGAIDLLSKI